MFVKEATEDAGGDEIGLVKHRFYVWIEKQGERNPKAALLTGRGMDVESRRSVRMWARSQRDWT